LRNSENLYEQIELLQTLNRLQGLSLHRIWRTEKQQVTVADLLDEVYTKAGSGYLGGGAQSSWVAADGRYWFVGCRDDYLVCQKQITVGSLEASLITQCLTTKLLAQFCSEDIRDRVLTQRSSFISAC